MEDKRKMPGPIIVGRKTPRNPLPKGTNPSQDEDVFILSSGHTIVHANGDSFRIENVLSNMGDYILEDGSKYIDAGIRFNLNKALVNWLASSTNPFWLAFLLHATESGGSGYTNGEAIETATESLDDFITGQEPADGKDHDYMLLSPFICGIPMTVAAGWYYHAEGILDITDISKRIISEYYGNKEKNENVDFYSLHLITISRVATTVNFSNIYFWNGKAVAQQSSLI